MKHPRHNSDVFSELGFRRAEPQKLRILAMLVLGWGMVPAFAADKTIEVEWHRRYDAVAITRVTLGGADVQCGLIVSRSEVQPVTPVDASGDWLENITIYLLNRTNKTIVIGRIALDFPETGTGTPNNPVSVCPISFGRLPPPAAFYGSGRPIVQPPNVQPILFAAGETLAINVSDYIDGIRAQVDPSTLSKVIIRRQSFFFADGIRWDGEYWTPHPERPGRWKRLDPSYFPGRATWPPGAR